MVSEVTKGLWAKKQAKLKRNQPEAEMPFGRGREKPFSGPVAATRGSEQDKENQVIFIPRFSFWFLIFSNFSCV